MGRHRRLVDSTEPGPSDIDRFDHVPDGGVVRSEHAELGAGTDRAFRAVGAPWLDVDAVIADLEERTLPGVRFAEIELSPMDITDVVVDPRFEGQNLPGIEVIITDLATYQPSATGLHLLDAISDSADGRTVIDRPAVFDLLAGTEQVRRRLEAGDPVSEITSGWDDAAAEFQSNSFAYLLYP